MAKSTLETRIEKLQGQLDILLRRWLELFLQNLVLWGLSLLLFFLAVFWKSQLFIAVIPAIVLDAVWGNKRRQVDEQIIELKAILATLKGAPNRWERINEKSLDKKT